MNFSFAEAAKVANQVMSSQAKRNLTDVEIIVLEGAWHRLEYDQIAAQNKYATSYISQDVAPKLWKNLSEALGEKVKKSNFKEALKRRWEEQSQQSSANVQPISALPTLSQSSCYVERPPIEAICYETLLQSGALIRIKAPTLMGKTYLVNYILDKLTTQNYRAANLSLELADRRTHFTNLDKFLRWLCLNLGRELGLPNQLDEYWDEEGMGSKVSCTTYLEEYLLPESDRPIVLCLDDVDLIFPYPEVYEDFFGLLRSWYEKARSRPTWQKLRLVIVHATDVYIRLNINQSPFNVGLPIELTEFTQEQVQIFAGQHGLKYSPQQSKLLMQMVGGHPYLLQQAFAHLKTHLGISLEQLLAAAPTDSGIYGNHLREHWATLQQHPNLIAALKTILQATMPVQLEPLAAYQLYSMGLVKLTGNHAQLRCQLYRLYFLVRLGMV
ncbi:AAA-like domain-containing protein [Nostoc sp. CHAB 5844]|nr:AAA-like domain-containing protein [Nostoc sp. CHAB 5844]